MTIRELKEKLKYLDDNTEVKIKRSLLDINDSPANVGDPNTYYAPLKYIGNEDNCTNKSSIVFY